MKVTSVKYLSDKCTVQGTENNGEHTHDVALKECPDKPRKKFLDAMAAVEKDLLGSDPNLRKLGNSVGLYGVAVSSDRHGHRAFVFDVALTVAWGTSHFALPRLRESVDGEASEGTLSEEALKHVDAWLAAAAEYFSQERDQKVLPLDKAS